MSGLRLNDLGFGDFSRPGAAGIAPVPTWILAGASSDSDFANNRFYNGVAVSLFSRASSKTDLLPSSASGFAYNTFAPGVLAITPGKGALIETSAATNYFINSTAPVTQTITLGTGNFTLWVNGAGSAAIAAGTATMTGAATATNGTSKTINVTVAGTVVVTITGALNAAQLEAGTFGTSFIVTAGVSATRAADSARPAGITNSLMASHTFSIVLAMGGSPATNPNLIRDGTFAYALKYNGTTSQNGVVAVAGVTMSGSLGSGTIGAANKFGFSSGAAGGSVVGNNGTVVTNAGGQWLGTASTEFGLNYMGYVSRITIFNTKLPDATLKALTV